MDNAAARNILALTGECSSAKEVVVAVQEAIERVEAGMSQDSDEDEPAKDERSSLANQLDVLISLYRACKSKLHCHEHFFRYNASFSYTSTQATKKVSVRYDCTADDRSRSNSASTSIAYGG